MTTSYATAPRRGAAHGPSTGPGVLRWVIIALVALLSVVGAIGAAGPAAAAPTSARCAATFNLFVPGTWETSENADPAAPVGMLAPITESVDAAGGAESTVYTLPYMARAFDNGKTYGDSKKDGIDRATAILEKIFAHCPDTQYTMTGYSQGSDVLGDLAAAIGNGKGPVPADRVLAVALVADPGSGTQGEAVVGPRADGAGIADPRPGGMGALSGRVASICDPGDLYCSIEKGSNPLLGSLGSILSKSTTDGATGSNDTVSTTAGSTSTSSTGPSSTQLASALTSDFSKADLPALGSSAAALRDNLTSTTPDADAAATSATSIIDTLSPLAELVSSGAANTGATSTLSAAAPGTPENSAAAVLNAATGSDLTGALTSAQSIARSASSGRPLTRSDASTLAGTADTLLAKIGPLAATNNDAAAQAMPVLSTLKPSVVLDQALNVATGVTSLDFPAILSNLAKLPERVAAGDAQGAHRIAGELNNQFSPLVTMAAEADLTWVSQVLSVIPDPSGYTQTAAMVTSILANVDVIRLANIVGQIQEIAWTAVEKLLPPPGVLPDLLGAGAAMAGLIPVGLDLASVAVGMLDGKVAKTAPELLGTQSTDAATSITTSAQNLDLAGLAGSVTEIAHSQGAQDLTSLVSQGISAASFFASGTHQSYGSFVVDNAGRTAIEWITDWLTLQIQRAA